jgi:hypothetical protein
VYLHKSAEKRFPLTVTTASYSVIENCNYVFQSAFGDGSVTMWNEHWGLQSLCLSAYEALFAAKPTMT